jgi:glutamine amidotransferase-like uncharacterized protein
MIIKYKKKRILFIKIISVFVIIFFFASTISVIQGEDNVLTFVSFIFQFFLWFGLYYYQAARYDNKKIIAQYGWPRIHYNDIISVKTKFGDIIIKSEKREISINRESVDEESLKSFIEFLNQKTPKPLNTDMLM